MSEHKLNKMTELRLEVARGKDVYITLQQGTAEIFGAELSLGQRVNLNGHAVAVFTWDGCTLEVEGDPDVAYVAEETPMASYINAHHAINNLRAAAAAGPGPSSAAAAAAAAASSASASPQGPRVVVAGPTDVGKSTLCRLLLNWAVRAGWRPTYVDLDVGQGTVTAPGCLAATPIETPVDVEEGYPVQVPLVFYYGHTTPSDAPELYRFLVERMASVLDRRAEASPEVASAGMIVNTLGWVEGLGYDLLLHVVKAIKADVVIVLEQDRLYNQLKSALAGETGAMGRPLQVAKLAKSGGIVARSPQTRKDARVARVREYFYGPDGGLQPHAQTVTAEQLQLFKIGGGFRAPSSALPLGATSKADPLRPAPTPVGPELTHSLLAVSHAQAPDQLASSNVAGFVLVTNVDTARGMVSYLAPCGGPLPGRYLLAGSLKAFLD